MNSKIEEANETIFTNFEGVDRVLEESPNVRMIAIENEKEDYYYRRYMFTKRYILYNRIGVNDYYIRESYLPQLPNGGGLDLTGTPIADLINKQNAGINKGFKVWNK